MKRERTQGVNLEGIFHITLMLGRHGSTSSTAVNGGYIWDLGLYEAIDIHRRINRVFLCELY